MRRVLLFVAFVTFAAGIGSNGTLPNAAAQGSATLILTPSSGDPAGTLVTISGSGWCPANNGAVLTGAISRTPPTISPQGNLSGGFTIAGPAGTSQVITVSTTCSGTFAFQQSASAVFTFLAPTPTPTAAPIPTATFTPLPTNTPTSTPTNTPTNTPTSTATLTNTPTSTSTNTPTNTPLPAATNTPVPAATDTPTATSTPLTIPSDTFLITLGGCDPAPQNVIAVFQPLEPGAPETATFVPVQRGPAARSFTGNLPASLTPGAFYSMTAAVNDPACPPDDPEVETVFIFGLNPPTLFVPAGFTFLWTSSAGQVYDDPSFYQWLQNVSIHGTLLTHEQAFLAQSTADADGFIWQVGYFPFAEASSLDLSPAGMIASGEVSCGDVSECQFSIKLHEIAAKSLKPLQPAMDSWQVNLVGSFYSPKGAMQNAFEFAALQGHDPAPPNYSEVKPKLDPASDTLVSQPAGPPTTYYFRAIPTKAGTPIGPPSGYVRLEWLGKFNVQMAPPEPHACVAMGTCDYKMVLYDVEVESYHGFISPVDSRLGCFIVVETTVLPYAGLIGPQTFPTKGTGSIIYSSNSVTYEEGAVLCPPKPKEPSFLESIVNFVVGVVNWVSKTYAAIKDTVIKLAASVLNPPCNEACVGTILDAGLVALGIPPSLPNFDQLMNEGLDYLAEQAVAQAGIPALVSEEAKAEVKAALQEGLKAMQKAYANQVEWLPKGVPVQPDPLANFQPPKVVLKVTNSAPPGTPTVCYGNGYDTYLRSDLQNDSPAAKLEMTTSASKMLYENKAIPLPHPQAGESILVPIVLTPLLEWGYRYAFYGEAAEGWRKRYTGGEVQFVTGYSGCFKHYKSPFIPTHGSYP